MISPSSTLLLGHSPDPDDAFMFYAMAAGKIPMRGYHFEHILQDIQTLNERAMRQELHLSAVSIHAYAHLLDHCYWVRKIPARADHDDDALHGAALFCRSVLARLPSICWGCGGSPQVGTQRDSLRSGSELLRKILT